MDPLMAYSSIRVCTPAFSRSYWTLVVLLTALLLFGVIIFFASRIVKEKADEQKARADEEVKKATPDPNE